MAAVCDLVRYGETGKTRYAGGVMVEEEEMGGCGMENCCEFF